MNTRKISKTLDFKAEALKANRTYQISIAIEIRKFTALYHCNIEKKRVLCDALRSRLSNETLDFGASLPAEDIKKSIRLGTKPLRISRKTSSVRRRIKLFQDDKLLIDSSGEEPLPNNDTLYISDVLNGIPRNHIQEKFSPLEIMCLKKALQLRIQMKLTHRACNLFSMKKLEGVDASDSYCKENNRIRSIDETTAIGLLEDSDWPYIANLLFIQTQPDRVKVVGAIPKRSAMDCQIYWENVATVNRGKWSEEELNRLKEIATRYNSFHWRKIASELDTGRTAMDCLQQWQTKYETSLKKTSLWTQDEDDEMVYLIKQSCGDADFLGISAQMDGRNQLQCLFRWRNILRPGIKMRKRFGPLEDVCLYLAVKARGANWKQLTPHLDDVSGPGRTDISARERFVSFLDPKLFFEDFSQSEEKVLKELMVKYFPDRIVPPPGKKHRKYALSPKEWKFVARKFRLSGNKRSTYQVKRTWFMMRRRFKAKKRAELPREVERTSRKKGTKRRFNMDYFEKAGICSQPIVKKTLFAVTDRNISV